MKDLKLIFNFLKKGILQYKFEFFIYIILVLIYNMAVIAEPYIIGGFIDEFIKSKTYSFILIYALVYLCVKTLSVVFLYFERISKTKLGIDLEFLVKGQMISHLQDASPSYVNHKGFSGMSQKINDDSNQLIEFILSVMQNLGSTMICFCIPIILIFSIDVYLGIGSIVLLPFNYALYKYFKEKLFSASREKEDARTVFFSKLYEQLFNNRFIKINNLGNLLLSRFVGANKQLKEKCLKDTSISFMYENVSINIDTLYQIILFTYGGYLIINKKMSVGEFMMLASYVAMISAAFSNLLNIGSAIQNNKVYYTRLKEIEDVRTESNGIKQIHKIDTIQIKNLTFSYGGDDVLKNVSREFTKGRIYAVAGKNGMGKSTFINLMIGLYIDEYKGDILYDGLSIKSIDMRYARETIIGITEQEPELLNASLRYNIQFNNNDRSNDENILEMAGLVGLHKYIASLNGGLDYVINDKSSNLSGGQKQKISLLRTLLKSPELMVLDEPTSALDDNSVAALMDYLQRIKSDKIIIIISHDEKVIKQCDMNVRINI